MSRIGKNPVKLPDGVTASLSGRTVEVIGPKGTRSFTASDNVEIGISDGEVKVAARGNSRQARQQWGMTRSMVANCVEGVVSGFRKEMVISGVGYRAQLEGTRLSLSLGLSHKVSIPQPEGITFTVPAPTRIVVEGNDKQQVGQVAAEIRRWRPPEPFKGKGISYVGEIVFRKVGKKK